MKKLFLLTAVVIISCTGCKDPYIPPVESLQNQLLVVEANLDPGGGPTTVRLSRTTKLNNSSIQAENNASVTVEGKDNTIRALNFTGSGNYFSPNLNLVINNEYRLRIRTSSGKEYLSDYVKALPNPPLDSISWERTSDGVQIYVNTNDPTNTIKYFRWDYTETWEIRSAIFSQLIYKFAQNSSQRDTLRNRIIPPEDISVCWKNSPSTQILLANSEQLQSSIISQKPIVFIPVSDEKILVRYSIIARQYALDKEGYKYFEIMKKNTEDIGSFFGPQPAEIKGNITCISKPDEPVIGFVTSSWVSEKRIFITEPQVRPWPNSINCYIDTFTTVRDSIKFYSENGNNILAYYLGNPPDRYFFGSRFCVDCTSRGGSNRRPIFW